MADETNDETHAKFLNLLDGSHEAVFLVSLYLRHRGRTVEMGPIKRAPTHGEWEGHADSGDIIITAKEEKDGSTTPLNIKVEAKKRGFDFTTADDFKFPDVIVCNQHSFDRADPIPDVYFHLSDNCKYAMIIDTQHHEEWTVRDVEDKRTNTHQDCYICKKDRISFIKFNIIPVKKERGPGE